ncbi:MAG TPA: hypothetical protein VFR09_08940 [Alphaproteobacteria bacterium]|nr:hypothetical protein [Alphaproteobacteria bacterium]
MAKSRLLYAGLLMAFVAAPAFAQTSTPTATGAVAGTNAAQQQEIENGLQSGQLSTKEAGRLENGEKRIDNTEARDLKKDGSAGLTTQQQTQIQNMQTNEQNRITKDDSNSVTGNPNSASDKRMQADVQRNENQQTRIENGANNGTMTNREAARAEKGQARVEGKEAHAARNGHVGKREQAGIQKSEDRQSGRIYKAKHNDHNAPGAAPAAAPAAPVAQ